ncbi:MAG TPA: hypothetical protein VMI31_11655, partial [Fimbriimonadaceae bacterium]|nr:hypothetical protein [Fimbriimonadaceae bacterium]
NEQLNLSPSQPVSSLTLKVYQYAMEPYENWSKQAWAGALVLLLFVLILSIGARLVVSRSRVPASVA